MIKEKDLPETLEELVDKLFKQDEIIQRLVERNSGLIDEVESLYSLYLEVLESRKKVLTHFLELQQKLTKQDMTDQLRRKLYTQMLEENPVLPRGEHDAH
jgi:hypothetical protein